VHNPVHFAHWVKNGPTPSLALSNCVRAQGFAGGCAASEPFLAEAGNKSDAAGNETWVGQGEARNYPQCGVFAARAEAVLTTGAANSSRQESSD